MGKWEQFWADVAQKIEGKFGRANPSQWDEGLIEEFLRHFEMTVKPIIIEDEDLAKNCGIKYKASEWRPMVPSTFRRIFSYKSSTGNKSTRNAFAIYLGYRSAEDYIYSASRNTAQNKKGNLPKTRLPIEKEIDKPIPVVMELPSADFIKDDERDEWMIYELAFLWHEKEPPSIQAHFTLMTRDIELTKNNFHKAVENGLLEARTETFPNGITRFITRGALEEYVKNQKLDRPDFLKKEVRQKRNNLERK